MRRRTLAWAAAAGLGIGFGLTCEYLAARSTVDWGRPRQWLPDLAVGVFLLAVAVWTGLRDAGARVAQRVAVLMLLVAVTWFVGTAWPVASFWHRAPLLHLLLAYPAGRPRGRARRAAVVFGYASLILLAPRANGIATGVLALAGGLVLPRAGRRGWRWHGPEAAVLVAATCWAVALIGGSFAGSGLAPMLLAVYQIVTCLLVLALACGTFAPAVPQVTDLMVEVIELGAAGSATLRDTLRRVSRDVTLDVGIWTPEVGAYLTPDGTPVRISENSDRTMTQVDRDGQRVAVLVHDLGSLGQQPLAAAVVAATQLTTSHTRLQSRLRDQADDVALSRRRLLIAADQERRLLGSQVQHGPIRRLALLRDRVAALATVSAPGKPPSALGRAVEHLEGALNDLAALASGLHPGDLDRGLHASLAALAARCPVPTEFTWTVADSPSAERLSQVETTVYFTTAEALANVVKHSGATQARVDVQDDGRWLRWTIRDNGRGGADQHAGTGLIGVTDRVAALGGHVTIVSASAQGTVVDAILPLHAPG
jgi:signal transduction histidine kinase